jgi:hypothetical protein
MTQRRRLMLDIQHHARIRQHERDIHHRILNADTPMGSASEHDVVFRILVGDALWVQPAVWDERFGGGKDVGVVHGVVEGGYNHASGWDGVVLRDGEWFGRDVRDLVETELRIFGKAKKTNKQH